MQQPNKPCKGAGNTRGLVSAFNNGRRKEPRSSGLGTADFRPRLCQHGGKPASRGSCSAKWSGQSWLRHELGPAGVPVATCRGGRYRAKLLGDIVVRNGLAGHIRFYVAELRHLADRRENRIEPRASGRGPTAARTAQGAGPHREPDRAPLVRAWARGLTPAALCGYVL